MLLHGQDDRLVVVVGPCSIHDHAQAMEYAHALKVQADALQDDLLIVMRVYFEKPRTTVGWKGLHQRPAPGRQLRHQRRAGAGAQAAAGCAGAGLPVGTEFLTCSPQFISDLVSWGAIGARHRKPEPPPAGQRPELPGGLQERHRRWRESGERRHPGRAVAHAFMGMTKMGQAAIFLKPAATRTAT